MLENCVSWPCVVSIIIASATSPTPVRIIARMTITKGRSLMRAP
jgi:hypothetical protein